MDVLVLGGGLSPEREVSLCSATMICNALIRLGHRAILVDAYFGLESFDGDAEALFAAAKPLPPYKISPVAPDLDEVRRSRAAGYNDELGLNVIELGKSCDLVYMGLHGAAGEDGSIQAVFDNHGIRYTGSGADACALAMDKWQTKAVFKSHGILTPEGCIIEKNSQYNINTLPVPCVVKPTNGGSSIGTSIVFKRSELAKAISEALCYGDSALVEEYISGRELACGVLGDINLPLIEIIPDEDFYNYENKYSGHTTEVTPAKVDAVTTHNIQLAARKVFDALKLEVYSRMDFILTPDGRAYCLEANTLPGMTPASLLPQEAAAAGIAYDEVCQSILDLSLKKYGK